MTTETQTAPAAPGLYVLFLCLDEPSIIQVGATGRHHFAAGCCAYIGSAQGPGGLRARLNRHLQPSDQKNPHWHIDYLLHQAHLRAIFWTENLSESECSWAAKAASLGSRFPPRFGASDCSCPGHLVQLSEPGLSKLIQILPPPGWKQIPA